MKICFLAHNIRSDNGGGVLARNIIEGLRGTLQADVTALTVVSAGLPYEKPILFSGWMGIIRCLLTVRRIAKECDVVHAFDVFPYGIIGFFAVLGRRKKFVITALGSGSIIPLYSSSEGIARRVLRRADRVIAISHFTKNEILEKVPDISIEIIHPGVDEEFLKPVSTVLSPRIQSWKPYIVSVGALRWRKGFTRSIRAFAKVREAMPDLQYVIVGRKYTDKEYQKIRAAIAELSLENSVHIVEDIDSKDKLREIYAGAELFCLLSQNTGHDVEGFGIVFLEAAATGLPAVGSAKCGIEDAVEEGRTGLLVGSNDVEGAAFAMRSILQNPELKQNMSGAAVIRARMFKWEEKISEYKKVYAGLN
jgi:phosphatidylinositol alpha-1,6-mannosyltransferase